MNKLLEDYNKSKENLVEKLANFHLRFESIHPFIDGNGRTGRLIINLELLKAGFPPINIKYSDRKAYFNAFEDYHKSKSTDNMAKLFTKYLSNSLETNINLLKISN